MSAGTGERLDLAERPYGVWWRPPGDMMRASVSLVRSIGVACYVQAGATESDARHIVDSRMNKAIQGDFARGRFEQWEHLAERVASGELNLRPEIKILKESPAMALLDLALAAPKTLMCKAAMDLAISKAKACGIGLVSVRSSAEFCSTNVAQAVNAGMIGIVMTQSYPLVAPLGGRRPMLGDAPIGFGVPAGDRDPVILDMALTNSSATGIRHVAEGNLVAGSEAPGTIAHGLLLNESGEPTTEASALFTPGLPPNRRRARGSLVPLGGGHKGYALTFVVTLLSSVLTLTNFPWEVDEIAEGGIPVKEGDYYGSVHIAIDPSVFTDRESFARRVDLFIDDIKGSPHREGSDEEILYPGEKSQRVRKQREQADTFLLPRVQYDAVHRAAELVGMASMLEDAAAAESA